MRVGLYTPHAMVEPPVADDEDDLDDPDDAVQIVLQPEGDVYEEEEEEGEEAPLEGEDVAAAAPPPDGSVDAADAAGPKAAARANVWVNPRLAGGEEARPAPAPAPKRALGAAQHAAKLKKLGPLAHVPGGADLDLSAPLPENVDIDTLEEKPWRNAGADLTDYFNYGFTEDTWRLYCARQLEIRRDRSLQRGIGVFESGQGDLPPEFRRAAPRRAPPRRCRAPPPPAASAAG